MRVRRWSVALSFLIAVACTDSPTAAPAGALLGHFGGTGAALVGTASEVQFSIVCGTYRFPEALVPDAKGSFALGPILVPIGAGIQGAITLRGTVVNGRLDVEYRVLTRAAATGSAHFVLTQNQPADYANQGCAA